MPQIPAAARVVGVLTLSVQFRIEDGHEDGPQVVWSVNVRPEQAGTVGRAAVSGGSTDDATSATYGAREGLEAALFEFIQHLDDVDTRTGS
jgi:hypothetical protein